MSELEERGVNSGACVTGGGAELSDPGVALGIAPDGDVVVAVRLGGGAGDVDVPVLDVLGFADVDHRTSESRMLMGAGGGGASTPPGIMAVLDKPGAGVHGLGVSGEVGVDIVEGVWPAGFCGGDGICAPSTADAYARLTQQINAVFITSLLVLSPPCSWE